MPKYLAVASYTSEGIRRLIKAGGTARRLAVDNLLKGLGGRLEAFYFAFGANDAYLILDVPDGRTAAAISMAVAASGAARTKTIALLMAEEIDQAVKKPAEIQSVARLRGIDIRSSNGLTRYTQSRIPRKTRGECHPRF